MDESTTLKDLKKKVTDFRDKRDWKKFHNSKDLSAAIVIESAELQERFLWKNFDETNEFLKDEKNFNNVKDEIADIGIFLLNLSDVLNVDLSEAITNKINKNEVKYPIEKVKGIAKKYTEL